jgi:ABC-type transport system involved in multi-copper enzyme maturation permease subunit
MGRLSRIAAVAHNTFRETVRERALYNLVFFAIIMILAGLLMRELSLRQDERIVKDVGLAAIDLFGLVIAVLIGTGLVSKEIERRSLHPLLAKPLSRTEFLLGRFGGLAQTLLVNVTAMTAGLYATLLLTQRGFDARLLPAVFALYLGLLVLVAIAVFFSTVTSSTLATVCTVALLAVGRYADLLKNMTDVIPGTVGRTVRWLYYVIPNFQNFDFKSTVVHGEPVAAATLGWVALYALVYLVCALGAAAVAFERRDLK